VETRKKNTKKCGYYHSSETIEKMKKSQMGRKHPKEEQKRRIETRRKNALLKGKNW